MDSKSVQMNKQTRKELSHLKTWYKPFIFTALSPLTIVAYAINRGIKLPRNIMHPAVLIYLAVLSVAFVWIQSRSTLKALGLLFLFALSSNEQRKDINNYYAKGLHQ